MKNSAVQSLYGVMNTNGTDGTKNIEQEGCPLIPNPHLHVSSFLFLFSSTYIRIQDINNCTYNNNDNDDDDDDDGKDNDKDKVDDSDNDKDNDNDNDDSDDETLLVASSLLQKI